MTPAPRTRPSRRARRVQRDIDILFQWGTGALAAASAGLFIAIATVLAHQAAPEILRYGPGFLTGTVWNPVTNVYSGAYPLIVGTLVTSAIAILLGVPISLGIAIFLAEQIRGPIATVLAAIVELLAAIPSVVYGLWAFFILVPYMELTVEPQLHALLGGLPGIGALFPIPGPTRGDLLSAGVVLAVMIIPTVSAVARESLAAVPVAQREGALALGATRWETTRTAVLPYARTALLGGIILGLGRALGETMAVTMTIGNNPNVPTSLVSGGQSIASAIATEYTNAVPQEAAALLEAALLLMGITVLVNVVARLMVRGLFRGATEAA